MRLRSITITLLLVTAGCGADEYATVAIGLGPVPANVRTLTVVVTDLDREIVVTSATVAEPLAGTKFELGVPAEVPLEFRAIGRTDRPGPPLVGGVMPAYAARAIRTIPLGRDIVPVDLLARPAGVLTFRPIRTDSNDDFVIAFQEEGAVARPSLRRFDGDRLPLEVAVVLPIGRYRGTATKRNGDPLDLAEGDGLFIAREQESVAVLTVSTPPEPDPDRVEHLRLTILDEAGASCPTCTSIATATGAPTRFDVLVEARGESSASIAVQNVTLMPEVEPHEVGRLTARAPPSRITAVSGRLDGFEVRGIGRLRIRVVAKWGDDLEARGDLYLDVGPADRPPTEVRAIELALAEPDRIAVGTDLRVLMLDADGRLTRPASGQISFEASDPFIYLPGGPTFDLAPDDPAGTPGVVSRRVARSSGPRGVAVSIVATLTSTAIPGTWTSTLTLPVLSLPLSLED